MGLAKPPCCHDAGGLLHHRFSFSLYALRRRWESSFLRRFPSDHSARPLAGIPPSGARTFLTRAASSTSRDRLAHSAVQKCNTPLPEAMAQRKRSTRYTKNRHALQWSCRWATSSVETRPRSAPLRLLGVFPPPPRGGMSAFFMHRQSNSLWTARQHCASRCQMQKGTRPLRTDPLKQVIVKPIYSASVSSSFFSEGSGVTSISTPRVSAADFMDREIRRRSRSISMTLT